MPQQSYKYGPVVTDGKWNGKTFVDPFSINKPVTWEKKRAVFVCSMGDLFHESLSFEDILLVWDVMCTTPKHLYIVLTKRPQRALAFMEFLGERCKDAGLDSIPTQSEDPLDYVQVPEFIWMGVTVENQEMADKRIPTLLQIPAKIRFLSCEPLLGPLEIKKYLIPGSDGTIEEMMRYHDWIDWVIVGGESGPKHRKMLQWWVESIMTQCFISSAAFFFKQWHKKEDGRLLEGVEYSEFPQLTRR
jgi:protein gp37